MVRYNCHGIPPDSLCQCIRAHSILMCSRNFYWSLNVFPGNLYWQEQICSVHLWAIWAPIQVPRKDIKVTNKVPRKYEDVVKSYIQARDVWKWIFHGNYVGTKGPLTLHSQEIGGSPIDTYNFPYLGDDHNSMRKVTRYPQFPVLIALGN